MRVDSLQVAGQNSLKVKSGTGAFTDSLKEGDRVRVDVVSSDKGAVVLKTDGGQVFKARLDTDAELSQGDKVLLEYSGREGKLIFLSIMRQGASTTETDALSFLVRDFEDKSLAPFAGKLSELRMTVTEDASRLMKDLITQNPGMTLEEAAFLASNKLTGDEGLLKAALNLLAGGEKTDAMISRLIDMLSTSHAPPSVPGETSFPLTDWIRSFIDQEAGDGAINASDDTGRSVSQGAQDDPPLIITQSDNDLQSRNVLNSVENLQNEINFVEKTISDAQNSTFTQAGGLSGEQASVKEQTEVSAEAVRTFAPGTQMPDTVPQAEKAASAPAIADIRSGKITDSEVQTPAKIPGAPATADVLPGITPEIKTRTSASPPDPGRAITELISELPEFRGTPPSALEKFSNMLLRIAKDDTEQADTDAGKLAAVLDSLFTRVARNDKDAGERLKAAKEELFARLSLVEEAISRSAPQTKPEIIEQTRRLIDHVRVMNSIDQFAYMQVPVRLGDEKKTAELYMFRRKNGRRVDPENANILLALDLENMGHWEGLINIRGKDVSVRMEVRGEEEKAFFSEKTVMLHELLAEAGFKLVNTSIAYSKEKTTPLTALSALDKLSRARSGGIDVVI